MKTLAAAPSVCTFGRTELTLSFSTQPTMAAARLTIVSVCPARPSKALATSSILLSTMCAIACSSPFAFSSVATTSALVSTLIATCPAPCQLAASSRMGEDRPGNCLQGQNLIDCAPFNSLIRHAEDHAGGLILGDGHGPRLFHFQHSAGAVI